MTTLTQFSVFLANRPAMLGQVCRALAEEKVNILAMTMSDARDHAVMRLVCKTTAKPRAALTAMNAGFTETDVLAVEMPNKPGAAADVCEKLSASKVPLSYMYCSAAGLGKALGIFKVGSIEKAKKALLTPRKNNREMKIRKRRPSPRR